MSSRAARALAAGSDAASQAAAMEMFPRGNAVDAVIAGVFAAAAVHASVLLGPVQMLVHGAGIGTRAVDGRVRQPGLGAPRPRGFRPEDAPPAAARVGTPALPAALAAALAAFGSLSLARVLAPALDLAKPLSLARRGVLKHIAERGPTLAHPKLADDLVRAAGRMAGGALTERDLEAVRPALVSSPARALGSHRVVTAPWGAEAVRAPSAAPVDASSVRVLAAVDGKGSLAIACYEVHEQGLVVPELDLVAPSSAAPVLRGKTRAKPGQPASAAAPIALLGTRELLELAVGIADTREAESALGAWILAQDALTGALPEAGRSVGVLSTGKGALLLGRAAFSPG